jgi:hypothetical protein
MAIEIFVKVGSISPILIESILKIVEVKREDSIDDEQKLREIPSTGYILQSQKQIIIKIKALEVEIIVEEGKRNELHSIQK